MFTKIFGGLCVVLLIGNLILYTLYQSSLADNEILKSNVASLTISKQEQDKTIESLLDIQSKNKETIQDYEFNNNKLVSQLSTQITEINNLRATLVKRSMDNPYGVGNIETESWYNLKVGDNNE